MLVHGYGDNVRVANGGGRTFGRPERAVPLGAEVVESDNLIETILEVRDPGVELEEGPATLFAYSVILYDDRTPPEESTWPNEVDLVFGDLDEPES